MGTIKAGNAMCTCTHRYIAQVSIPGHSAHLISATWIFGASMPRCLVREWTVCVCVCACVTLCVCARASLRKCVSVHGNRMRVCAPVCTCINAHAHAHAPGPLAESIEGAVSALQVVNHGVLQLNAVCCGSVAALRKPRN